MNNKYKFSCNHRLETLYFLSSIYCKRLEFIGEEFYAFSLMKFPFETANTFTNNKIKNRIGQLNLKLEIMNKYKFPQTFMQSSFRNIGTELYISLFSLDDRNEFTNRERRGRGGGNLCNHPLPSKEHLHFFKKKSTIFIHSAPIVITPVPQLHPILHPRILLVFSLIIVQFLFPFSPPRTRSFFLLLLLLSSSSSLDNERGNGRFSGATRLTDSSDNHGESYRPILGATDVSA